MLAGSPNTCPYSAAVGEVRKRSEIARWEARASAFLKAELKKAGVTYTELIARLKKNGFKETEASITMKLKRGTFNATWFLAALVAIGAEVVKYRIENDPRLPSQKKAPRGRRRPDPLGGQMPRLSLCVAFGEQRTWSGFRRATICSE